MDPIKQKIFDAAMAEAEQAGAYDKITRGNVASRAECSTGMINNRWGTMADLISAVLTEFIERRDLKQIALALINKAPEVANLDEQTRRDAALTLVA